MRIAPSTWHLLQPPCSCCDGQGQLCFSACPQCGHVVLTCSEVGTVFRSDASTFIGEISDPVAICPNCQGASLSSFRNANSTEIQALGFTPAQYA